ncbi:transcription elongation factor GreA [Patescibacteria group bacterium]|nr:transcription elongation factor GreA [Patescibacteria group bacterium]
MEKIIYITKEGLEKLKLELQNLINIKRPKTVEMLSVSKSQGDLSENAGYHSAREELEYIDKRIFDIEQTIKTAVVSSSSSSSTITVGATVTVTDVSTNADSTYMLVGSTEADPIKGKISNESPIGSALMGKKVGDTVTITTPMGEIKYKIKKLV